MNEVRCNSYEFSIKPTFFGYVVMYRESEPDNAPGCWRWGKWQKATWFEMLRFSADKLR